MRPACDVHVVGLNFCLRKTGGQWSVIVDLSRTDVPDWTKLATIKRALSDDFLVSFSLLHAALREASRFEIESAKTQTLLLRPMRTLFVRKALE